MTAPQDSGTPRVSILMPAFNAEDTIAAAIASVRAQSIADWELIVVDDGSIDATADVARTAAAGDPRITVLAQANAGCGVARNNAASHARGEFLALLDADDEYLPMYLDRMLALAERRPDRDLYSCNGYFVFPGGKRKPVRKGAEWQTEREFTVDEMLVNNLVFPPAMIRRATFERLGGFRRRMVEDFDLWMRVLLTGGRHAYTPELLVNYNLTPDSISKSVDALHRAHLEVMETAGQEHPEIRGPHFEYCIGLERMRVEFAELERRIVQGDLRGARRGFFAAWPVHRTLARKYVGGATMLLHPGLYRRVFLGNLYPDGDRGKA